MLNRRALCLGLAALGLAGATAAGIAFRRDLRRAGAATDPSLSFLASTRIGAVEYAVAGTGPALLMLHGTGGGFDQGLLMAAPLIAAGIRVVAPSRFGYLRTPMPPDADHWAEARAMADLLDALELERVAVAGVSAGAIPALAFAQMFPDRCAALLPIVPAFFLPGRAPVAPWTPLQERAVRALLSSDFLFWSAMTLVPNQIVGTVLATDPALVAAAGRQEHARVGAVMRALLPISRRTTGILYDGIQANRPLDLDLAAIVAPTLALSCDDDRYRTAENARHIAATVPGASARVFPSGGHVWVGRSTELTAAVIPFLGHAGIQ